ncbi:MAG: Nif3-like dinuclear metal center hexameric protein [Bacteroidia bacterium]|nr:Nif3-like dinuclear metal center hexameric protein [Bacteroidia bacterium]
MKIEDIINEIERIAPPALQEDYDNSGLITGSKLDNVEKALLCLDSTEEVVQEAIDKGCGLIIAHHPIIFKGLKKINGSNYVERAIIKAIKNNIAIYACHTNIDNVLKSGVNGKIADKLNLHNRRILRPMSGKLLKLSVFVPVSHTQEVLNALFAAGAGHIGNYDECSFAVSGSGTFRAGEGAQPFVGKEGERHTQQEEKVEVILPNYILGTVLQQLNVHHPYEEVAYEVYELKNQWLETGSGLIGELENALSVDEFLAFLKDKMELKGIRYTKSGSSTIKKVALCGGAGSFLIGDALRAGADAYVTGDVKYHEFFDAENRLMVCDIGHYESEKFTIPLFAEILSVKFPNFATIFANTNTNPVNYY